MMTLIENENGCLKYEFFNGEPLLHLNLHRWNKSLYIEYLQIWEVALDVFREKGYRRVLIAIPAWDKKLIKFEQMFGFKKVNELAGVLFMERIL